MEWTSWEPNSPVRYLPRTDRLRRRERLTAVLHQHLHLDLIKLVMQFEVCSSTMLAVVDTLSGSVELLALNDENTKVDSVQSFSHPRMLSSMLPGRFGVKRFDRVVQLGLDEVYQRSNDSRWKRVSMHAGFTVTEVYVIDMNADHQEVCRFNEHLWSLKNRVWRQYIGAIGKLVSTQDEPHELGAVTSMAATSTMIYWIGWYTCGLNVKQFDPVSKKSRVLKPVPGFFAPMMLVVCADRLYVWGQSGDETNCVDLACWDGSAWHRRKSCPTPNPRTRGCLAYSAVDNTIVMLFEDGDERQYCAICTYNTDTDAWRLLHRIDKPVMSYSCALLVV